MTQSGHQSVLRDFVSEIRTRISCYAADLMAGSAEQEAHLVSYERRHSRRTGSADYCHRHLCSRHGRIFSAVSLDWVMLGRVLINVALGQSGHFSCVLIQIFAPPKCVSNKS